MDIVLLTKKAGFLLLLLFLYGSLAARVVINEVCYDPEGTDGGNEWLELYNAGNESIDLSGCKIYSGGSSFTTAFAFPYYVLRPGRFVLIGGSNVPNTQFVCNFSFQNGGSASDIIRYCNADSSYTDTVIYDEPNTYLLPDDLEEVAQSFAVDVPEGYALARKVDGVDTNLCAQDFMAEANPTPGLPNRSGVDYAILTADFTNATHLLSFYLHNLSEYTPTINATLKVYEGLELLHEESVPPIPANDSLQISIYLDAAWQSLTLQITLPEDENTENNVFYLYSGELTTPVINEIFPYPASGMQEWIEVFQEYSPRSTQNYQITDASGGDIVFSLPPLPGYYVLCTDSEQLVLDYPSCPSANIIQVSGWTYLNNDGDVLELSIVDEEEPLDTMQYTAEQLTQGKSLERHYDEDSEAIWRISNSSAGATPGLANSSTPPDLPPQDKKVKIIGSPIDAKLGENLQISYSFSESESKVNCYIFDLAGIKIRTLAENTSIPARGNLSWDGRKSNGSYAKRGIYLILWESQAIGSKKVYRKQLSAVVK